MVALISACAPDCMEANSWINPSVPMTGDILTDSGRRSRKWVPPLVP